MSGTRILTKNSEHNRGHKKMKRYQTAILIILLAGCTHAASSKQTEPDYGAITKRIRSRIMALQEQHSVLKSLDVAPRPNKGAISILSTRSRGSLMTQPSGTANSMRGAQFTEQTMLL